MSASTAASGTSDADLRFAFAFARPELVAGRMFGITPDTAEVTLHDDQLLARFGPWRVETSLLNVAGADVSGPYQWPKIIGPPRVSLRDRGLTFATNDQAGVCIRFREPVRGIDPLGVVRHPGLTVTVDDPAGLVSVLEQAAQLAEEASARAEKTGRSVAPTVGEVLDEVSDDLHSLTASELRERARALGIDGVGSMKKDELVDALIHHPAPHTDDL